MGRRGREFGRTHARANSGRRFGAARPRSRARVHAAVVSCAARASCGSVRPLAGADRSRDARARARASFAPSRLPRSTISNARSPRRAKPPLTDTRIPRSAASARPNGRRRRRSRATSPTRSAPCAPLAPTRPCATASRASRRDLRRGRAARGRGGRARVRAIDRAHGRMERGGGRELPDCARRIRRLVRRCAGRRRAPRRRGGGHPRLQILGLLEARLLSFDRVLLAGLDETVWPPAVQTDAFLNRPMRAALGLSAPERRIGQTAHDFVAALGAREAILSRAKKRGGEPTVASRFLQRMAAAAGAEAMTEPEERGERYLASPARSIGRPASDAQPKTGAAPPGRASPQSAQRHADRDPAARPLRDLRRTHSPV